MQSFRLDQRNRLQETPRRASGACAACHARRIRCDVGAAKPICSFCQRDGRVCEQRPRKQRRTRGHEQTAQSESSISSYGSQQKDTSASQRDVSASVEHGHIERAMFMGPEVLRAQDGQQPDYTSHVTGDSDVNRQICDLQQAYALPSRSIQLALFENFWENCYPWDPIVERFQVVDVPSANVSPLLLQAIFLGGSRVSAASLPSVSPEDFYRRAKTLFWTDQERDPLTKVIAASLLHWYNPHGPELVSTNTSTFWNRIAIGLAMQLGVHSAQKRFPDEGLRRRIWWMLVARDCLISAAHGRPQAINLDHCDVPRPTLHDFPLGSTVAPVFVAYVDLAVIVGKFVNYSIRRAPVEAQITDTAQRLLRWVGDLPPMLRLHARQVSQAGSHTSLIEPFNIQRLSITYYAAVSMLYRARTSDDPFPTAAAIAGSTIASIFEDFLARDLVRRLSPVYTFYLLVASVALLSCYGYKELWRNAEEDLRVISLAQEEMKKRWGSAKGSIRSFEKMYAVTVNTQVKAKVLQVELLNATQAVLLEDVQYTSCRLWPILTDLGFTYDPAGTTADMGKEKRVSVSWLPSQHPEATTASDQSQDPQVQDQPGEEFQLDEDFFGAFLFWEDLSADFT